MEYLKFHLGQQRVGALVEVTLSGAESDVFLVDSTNLAAFERGARYRYFGGHYKRSPVRLGVPSSGSWTAVVVPIGGRVKASARVVAAA